MLRNAALQPWLIAVGLVQLAVLSCDGDGAGRTTDATGGSGGAGRGTGGATTSTIPSTGGTTQATTSGSGGLTQGTGGDVGTGGVTMTGGSTGAGGTEVKGGTTATGGSAGTGGTTSAGGTRTTGGVTGAGGIVATGGTPATGGVRGSGGTPATGGIRGSGGTPATGGIRGTGGATVNPNAVGPSKTSGCLTSTGNYSGNPLTATIVVNNGQVYDGGCKTFVTKSLSSGGLGDGSQEEDQKPLFRVNAGGKLMNVILGAPAADGVHFYGNATAENIHWLDIGEDAATIKADANVTLDCGSAKNGADKVFQVNAKATWTISNFTIRSAGKTMRENGGECYPVTAIFDHCDISDMDEVIFRTDCTSSKVTISNTRYSQIQDGLVMVGSSTYNASTGNITITNVQKY
jgi:hypothetical protein